MEHTKPMHNAQFGYVQSQFEKHDRWAWQTTLDAIYNHSVDHALQAGMTENTPNAVNTYTLHDAISLSYQYNDFTARAMFAGVIPRARCVTSPHLTHLTTNMD